MLALDNPITGANSSKVASFTRFSDLKCFNNSTTVLSPMPMIDSSSVFNASLLRLFLWKVMPKRCASFLNC